MFERRWEKNVSRPWIRRVCRDVCESKSTRLARRGSPYFREIRGTSCRSRVTSLQHLSSQQQRPLSTSVSTSRPENDRLSLTLDGTPSRVYKQRESLLLNRRMLGSPYMLSRCGERHLIFHVPCVARRYGNVERRPCDYNSNFGTWDYHPSCHMSGTLRIWICLICGLYKYLSW